MAIISSKRRRALLCRLPEQEEREDGLTIIHGTVGFAASAAQPAVMDIRRLWRRLSELIID